MKPSLTVCGFCGCGCGLYLDLDTDKRASGVIPSDGHPVNKGRLCRRGWHVHQPLRSANRLLTPQCRREEGLVPVSWEEAVEVAAKALERAQGRIGVWGSPNSTNEDAFLLMKLARTALGTNNVDFFDRPALVPTQKFLRENSASSALCLMEEISSSEVLLIIGLHSTERFPQITFHLLQARLKGAALINVDEWYTDLTRYATLQLEPRLQTDAIWLHGLASLLSPKAPVSFTPEEVESLCGLPAVQLQEVADLLGRAERIAIIYDTTNLQRLSAPEEVEALATLVAVLREEGQKWCGVIPTAERCNTLGTVEMGVAPNLLTGYQSLEEPEVRGRFKATWEVELPAEPGYTALQMIEAAAGGKLSALIVVGDDWLPAYPWPEQLSAAWDQLDSLIVIASFPSDLTARAEVVFPRPLPGEVDGTYTNLEGRVQLLRSAVRIPQGGWREGEIFAALGRALGYEMRYESTADIRREIAALTPSYSGLAAEEFPLEGIIRNWEVSVSEKQEVTTEAATLRARVEAGPKPTEEYPFLLAVERLFLPWHFDPVMQQASTLRREFRPPGAPLVFLHPETAQEAGVRSGNPAVVRSPQGEATFTVLTQEFVPRSMALLPQCFSPLARPVLGEAEYEKRTGGVRYPLAAVYIGPTRGS